MDPPAAVSTTALHSKLLHLLSCLMTLNIQPANGMLSSLDKLPWQMRTVEFVRRLASVSVSDTVSFVDNLMKICEARTSVVYSLHTDTHDLPSTHSPVLDDDADAVESTSTSTATASIINVVVAAVSSSSLVTNNCAASIDDTHALPPIHLGRTIIRLRDGLLRSATTDTQALNLLISSLASFIHPAS